jgi:hypothetical protein
VKTQHTTPNLQILPKIATRNGRNFEGRRSKSRIIIVGRADKLNVEWQETRTTTRTKLKIQEVVASMPGSSVRKLERQYAFCT